MGVMVWQWFFSNLRTLAETSWEEITKGANCNIWQIIDLERIAGGFWEVARGFVRPTITWTRFGMKPENDSQGVGSGFA